MYIIAGLGNPGKQYAQTRHNVGFDTIDILADKYNISVDTKKHKALCGKGMIEASKLEGKTLVFLKPCDTYSFNQLIKEHPFSLLSTP